VPFELQKVPGDKVRIPDQRPGVAWVISRYSAERAVVMHPADFHRLEALDALLAEAAATDPLVFGDAAIAAHRAEETPGNPITDPAQLAALFG
jgi:hypothetical protein